ncbi:hypothetical protein [Serratia liquefaciens]|uniref:hypothetical protein n=1 Tax=Serratia liquefaciens TaxID=614 RepID=UPI0022B979A1|nr:hypothetical protein [Serratia liquefaciens]
MAVQHKIMAAANPERSDFEKASPRSEGVRTSAAAMGYIGRPREAQIPDLEMSFESLDSLLNRERQLKS